MKETSTPISKPKVNSSNQPMPKRSTIELIKGFARAYTADRRLQPGISGLVLN